MEMYLYTKIFSNNSQKVAIYCKVCEHLWGFV